MGSDAYHRPVLFHSVIDGLRIRPDGTYVDATFGGGGHARGILDALGPGGRLFAFDQDPDAARNAEALAGDPRFTLIPENFRHLHRFLRLHGALPVDGILADLGVSSWQIDTPERGFSIRFDGPLDGRMDRRRGITAAEWLATAEEAELHRVLGAYGEVRNARKLARVLVEAGRVEPITTCARLRQVAEPLSGAPPGPRRERYLAQVFQALRIVVNDEMAALEEFLLQTPDCLAEGGVLAVITYHSLEDRPVKRFLLHGTFGREPEKDAFGNPLRPLRAEPRKPVLPTENEIRENPRARSAKLRIGLRLADPD
jgi:16S rRNA (cytosine1402-N4)-methyltransferase